MQLLKIHMTYKTTLIYKKAFFLSVNSFYSQLHCMEYKFDFLNMNRNSNELFYDPLQHHKSSLEFLFFGKWVVILSCIFLLKQKNLPIFKN